MKVWPCFVHPEEFAPFLQVEVTMDGFVLFFFQLLCWSRIPCKLDNLQSMLCIYPYLGSCLMNIHSPSCVLLSRDCLNRYWIQWLGDFLCVFDCFALAHLFCVPPWFLLLPRIWRKLRSLRSNSNISPYSYCRNSEIIETIFF